MIKAMHSSIMRFRGDTNSGTKALLKEKRMKAYRIIFTFSTLALMIAMFSGCDNKQEKNKNEGQQSTLKAKAKAQQQNAVTEAHKEATIRDLTGSAAEYAELHMLFCKQHKDVNLSQREIKRLAYLEDLAEIFTDTDHMDMYRKTHNPDNC